MSSTIESMIARFRGKTKAEMIAKYNHPNCAPQWSKYDRLLAQNAMRLLLAGKVPNEKTVPPTIEEILAPLPESVVEKVAVKTEDMIFQEELMTDLPIEDGLVGEAEGSDGAAKCDQPEDPLALTGLRTNFKVSHPFQSPSPAANAVRKPGRPKRSAGGMKA
jgi:hypothetical protein